MILKNGASLSGRDLIAVTAFVVQVMALVGSVTYFVTKNAGRMDAMMQLETERDDSLRKLIIDRTQDRITGAETRIELSLRDERILGLVADLARIESALAKKPPAWLLDRFVELERQVRVMSDSIKTYSRDTKVR